MTKPNEQLSEQISEQEKAELRAEIEEYSDVTREEQGGRAYAKAQVKIGFALDKLGEKGSH